MILIIDNYDSFVFNVVRYLEELGRETRTVRNDRISLEDVEAMNPSGIVVSPGPCTPREAGISIPVIERFSGRTPLLGVCLGHQCIGAVFGGRVVRAHTPMHGRPSMIRHSGRGLFENLPVPLRVGRYHSLIVEPQAQMDGVLDIDAMSEDGEVMALSHRKHPTFGVQFHPESILTEHGHRLFQNFLAIQDRWSDGYWPPEANSEPLTPQTRDDWKTE